MRVEVRQARIRESRLEDRPDRVSRRPALPRVGTVESSSGCGEEGIVRAEPKFDCEVVHPLSNDRLGVATNRAQRNVECLAKLRANLAPVEVHHACIEVEVFQPQSVSYTHLTLPTIYSV